MMPTIQNADTIAFDRVKKLVAEVLKTTREVDAWRNDYDPGTQEWYTLCNLAETAESLALSLPVEMLPDEEWRHVSPAEYAACDDILAALKEAEGK
ncbi:hypothetical protein OG824_18760 [Streptomyces prunicolor]|uniref:hypothetical protein n=1 Tax=Streptomyces TaxID=1883 RepID=UPI00224FDDDE|nr:MULTISPECIES: hypothetical protein [Streptomyces]MCX5237244.1 hypothetical protein [Streptomyces prunicolor]WSP73879.1 hypothetical protein OG324_32300 [Streptomyces sp. NBC_01236]